MPPSAFKCYSVGLRSRCAAYVCSSLFLWHPYFATMENYCRLGKVRAELEYAASGATRAAVKEASHSSTVAGGPDATACTAVKKKAGAAAAVTPGHDSHSHLRCVRCAGCRARGRAAVASELGGSSVLYCTCFAFARARTREACTLQSCHPCRARPPRAPPAANNAWPLRPVAPTSSHLFLHPSYQSAPFARKHGFFFSLALLACFNPEPARARASCVVCASTATVDSSHPSFFLLGSSNRPKCAVCAPPPRCFTHFLPQTFYSARATDVIYYTVLYAYAIGAEQKNLEIACTVDTGRTRSWIGIDALFFD